MHRFIWNAGLFICLQLQHSHQSAMDGLVGFMVGGGLELEMAVECMVTGGRVKVGRFRAALGVVVCLGREGLWIWDWFFSVVVVPWERGSLVAFSTELVGVL